MEGRKAVSRVVSITDKGRSALAAANASHARNEIAQLRRIAEEFDQERMRLEAEPDDTVRRRSLQRIDELDDALDGIRVGIALLERRIGIRRPGNALA